MENKSPKKLKIGIVAPAMNHIGGQSIQADRLTKAFAGDENIELKLIPNNPQLKFFGFLQQIPLLRTLATSLKFWRILLKETPACDAVQIFSSGTTSYIVSTVPALFAAKLFNIKAILNYHHGGLQQHLEEWKLTALPTMKMFDEIVVPSAFLVGVFAKYGLKACAVANFVETEKFAFRARNPLEPIFLSNRNFEPHYNVGGVLRAFELIQKRLPEARLIVAGYGAEELRLKELAANLSLRNIEFTGKIANEKMPEIYNRADVYLNASLVDNMPLSLIEAFSCGLPVVSGDAGGIPHVVKNSETGLLVKPRDFDALAENAVKLFNDNGLAQKIIRNAKLEAEKYSLEKVTEDWREFYQSVKPV